MRLERAGDRAHPRHHARATLPAGPDVRRAHAGLPAGRRVARRGRERVLVVPRPAQVFVDGARERGRGRRQPEVIEPMFEDGVDMPVGARADGDGAGAGGLQPGGPVALDEAEDAETGAVALLGVRAVGEDGLDEGGGLRAEGAGPVDEAGGGPLQVALMGFGHVGGLGGVPAPHVVADMGGHALAAMEQLDRGEGQAGVDVLVDEGVGDRVVMPVQLDVVVDVDAGVDLPLADDEALGGQRAEGGLVQAHEEVVAAGAVEAHRAGVQVRAGARRCAR